PAPAPAPAQPAAPAKQAYARDNASFGEPKPIEPSAPVSAPPQYGHPVQGPDQEQQQMAQLYQISKRCMSAQTLAELDRLLINTLENAVQFERGFITYQLPSGDWKLVMSPKGDRWERRMVRDLLQASLRAQGAQLVVDSRKDNRLGQREDGGTDQRLLLPLRTQESPVGTIFLIANAPGALGEQSVDFLTLFSDVAALAIVNCARIDRGL
ncbi:MAG: GAF domain-containing protein, partial [Myxococcales bacterium]|nr:GAF domain-containing protein [Myxococcales bacterium]